MAEIDARLPQLELIRPWDAVILAAGDFPSSARALQALREAPHLVCCDGAWEGLRDAGLKADRVIGDGDSLTAADKAELGETFVHISEQESNDLTKAVRYASAQGWTRLLLLGATGKREDNRYRSSISTAATCRQRAWSTRYGLLITYGKVRSTRPRERPSACRPTAAISSIALPMTPQAKSD